MARLVVAVSPDVPVPVDLARATGTRGPLWGMQSADLNATLLAWPAGEGVAAHENVECDVLVVVMEGSLSVRLDGIGCDLSEGQVLLLPRASERSLTAGPSGVRYLSVHRRRGPLLPQARATRAAADAKGPACADPKS
jgi:quercetin dioxygenase-like cupin family protein